MQDFTTEAGQHFRTSNKAFALQLIHAGATLASDGFGPVMNFYTEGFLNKRGLTPAKLREIGAMPATGVTVEEWIERGAMECVRRKTPGHLIFIFKRDSVLDTYLAKWEQLVKHRNECAKQGVEFKLPPLNRNVEETAIEDFAREIQRKQLDGAAWARDAFCDTSRVEHVESDPARVLAGTDAQGKSQAVGAGGRNAKRWTLGLDNETRAELGLHNKPI